MENTQRETIRTRPFESDQEKGTAFRSRAYSLLAEAFRYPDEAMRKQAREGDFRKALETLLTELPYPFALSDSEKNALRLPEHMTDEDFEVEFVRLFESGPGGPPCPLVEGSYTEDRRVVLKELILFYNHFGLSYEQGAQDERPDHLCLEMEFLHYLTFKEVHAIQAGADPAGYRRAQRDFLERHPCVWMEKISERLDRIWERLDEDACAEAVRFYRSLVKLVNRFVEEDLRYLQGILASGT